MGYKVLELNKGKAYMPEILAYQTFFNGRTEFTFYNSADLVDWEIGDFDVIWSFMGIDCARHNKIRIHDYASLSTGKFPYIKNKVKKVINEEPNLRLFLNRNVREGFKFNDSVPHIYRDMGVKDEFFYHSKNTKKEWEFVYVGSISRARGTHIILDKFISQHKKERMLLIGSVGNDIYDIYKKYRNIVFAGKLDYAEVPRLASKAVYGINYVPNIYPYNLQTSTKVLEYCAMGLKTITNSYTWINEFENRYNARFYHLGQDMNFENKKLQNYDFIVPNVEGLNWENVLDNSGLLDKLKSIIK